MINIEELLEEMNIKISSQSGYNVYACCPFHDDKNPSWGINVNRESDKWGFWGCYGCHETGNIATLVLKLNEDIKSYLEAINWLFQRAGLLKDRDVTSDLILKSKIRQIKQKPQNGQNVQKYMANFLPIQEGTAAWNYLILRGLTHRQIIRSCAMIGTGFYKDRVVFPIWDQYQKMVSFYARAIKDLDKKGLYLKGSSLKGILWGMHQFGKFTDPVYIVEGIFDALAVERALKKVNLPSRNILAVLKSTISQEQADFINKFSTSIILPDMKGSGPGLVPSAKKYLRKEIKIVQVEKGHDPDSQERKGDLEKLLLKPQSAYKTSVRVFVQYDLPKGE